MIQSIYEVHIELVRDRKIDYKTVRNAEIAAEIAFNLIKQNDREHIISISLNGKNQPVNVNIVHVGSTTQSLVRPKDVIKPAILSNAAAVIMVHNHPSGELLPSDADNDITQRMVEACKLLDLRFLDSIIIGPDGFAKFYSFADEGRVSE